MSIWDAIEFLEQAERLGAECVKLEFNGYDAVLSLGDALRAFRDAEMDDVPSVVSVSFV